MDLQSAKSWIELEWAAMIAAPTLFFGALLALSLLSWLAINWLYRGRLETLRDGIDLVRDRFEREQSIRDTLEAQLREVQRAAPWIADASAKKIVTDSSAGAIRALQNFTAIDSEIIKQLRLWDKQRTGRTLHGDQG